MLACLHLWNSYGIKCIFSYYSLFHQMVVPSPTKFPPKPLNRHWVCIQAHQEVPVFQVHQNQ